jgi:hypothetical protein
MLQPASSSCQVHRTHTARLRVTRSNRSLSLLVGLCEPVARGPAKGGDRTLAHGRNALCVVAGAVGGVGVNSLAAGLLTILAKGSVHRDVVLLLGGRCNQVLSSLRSPSVDEVTVRAVGVAAGKLDRCGAAPSLGKDFAEIVADGEAQLRHSLHARRASLVVAGLACLVSGLEGLGVDACSAGQCMLG